MGVNGVWCAFDRAKVYFEASGLGGSRSACQGSIETDAIRFRTDDRQPFPKPDQDCVYRCSTKGKLGQK